MFGDEESCSKKLKEVDEKDFREDEDIGKETKCHEIVNNNISHDDRNNEQMENRKKETIKQKEIDENRQAPFQINCGDDGVSELVENEESVDLTSVDVESINFFNEKYSHVKIPSEKNELSSGALTELSPEQEPLENETGKSKSNTTSKQKLDNSSFNEDKNVTSSTAVLSSEQQHKLDTNSTLINGLQDKSVPAPTSTQSIPESGFSSILSSNPMFIGSLVTHNGSMYYQPNTGLSIPHISPGMNYHCYVMVPNRHDPNSTASIPDFLVNPNSIQVPLLTNWGQLTTGSRASIISLESFQRAYSMTSSGVCNPNSMVTIPMNQPSNILGTPANTSVISLESLQQALCSVMLPTGGNPNSNLPIPLNQPSEVRPACSSSAVISSKTTESISCSSNTVTSSLKNSNEPQGLATSHSSTCTHDVETILVAEDQSSIRNVQDSKLSTVEDSCDTQDCRDSGSSQTSILTHDNMAEDQTYIRNMQDSRLSIAEDTCDTQDCRGSGSSQMSILTHDNMKEDQVYISEAQDQNSSTPADNSQNQVSTNPGSAQIFIITEPASDTCQESSPNIPQGCSVSTPTHENGVCMSSELSYFATTTECTSETDQESSTNILQDCSVSTPADENRVCKSSPSFPICSTAESASETCQESSSSVHQDCSVSTPAVENRVCESSPSLPISSTAESASETCQESSSGVHQDCSVSTPADEIWVWSSPLSRVCSTAESVSETCQESSTNISQDCSVSIPVYTCKEVPTEVEEEERCRDLPQEQNIIEVTVQNTNDSSLSNSSSQFKHLTPKNSTLIRVSPRYSETKGCCSPLVRVSKNVSPLQPIRGNKQHYVITQGHDRRMVSEERREKEAENGVKIRRPIYLKGTPPQGYKRRLLTTAAKTTNYLNKVERKKCSSVSSSRSLITTLQDQTKPEQKNPKHTIVKEPGSSELEKSLEDKTPKEAGVPSDLDTQKLETLSPSDPKTTFGPQTPNRTWECNDPLTTFMLKILRESSAKKEARKSKIPSKSISFETTTGCQEKEEPGTSNIPDTQETPNKTGSPEAFITVEQTKTPINTQTPNKTPSNENSKTFKDQKTPNDFRTPNVKVFKATRTEDKEKKRNREHRNCLELRDEFQYLCRLLPGTKRTWSRVQVLYQAIQYIRHMQEFLKGYGGIPNNGQLALDDKENDGTSLTCDQESISTDHVVPRSLDSFSLGQYWEFCMRERAEEQNSIPNFNVVENPEDLQVEENSIYILYPNTNTNEEESTGSCTPTEVGTFNPTYGVVSGSIEEHSAACQCIYCIRSAVGDGENLYSDMEQDIAVRNIEGYRMNENYMQIAPDVNGQCASEFREASESEERRAPEVREVSEAEGRRAPEVRGVSEDQSQSNTVTKKQAEFQIEVLSEGCAFGYDEEGTNGTNSSTRYLEWNSSPRGYFPINNFSNSMIFPSEQNGPSSPRVLYTTSPSLAGVLVSPVFVVSEEHMHSKTESKDDNHDQEPPCTPPYGAFRHSNVTKDLSPFVVPQSPGGLSLVMGGSPGQFQMEDFSQSPNSQESQSTAFGVITEDALNYIGATISPFATPRLDFLPSFIELSPSQVIPEQTSVQEEHHEHNEPNVSVTGVTDFTDVGLTSVAASVEIPAESTDEVTQRKPRKKRKSLTKGQDQTESAKKPRRRYKKVKSPVQKKGTGLISDQDRTDYLSLSPIQTWSSLNDYNTFKTPSPRIRGKKVKRTSDGDASEVIDNESDCVPLCPLPKKRGRKPKKSQNAECKRQLMNEEPLLGLSEGYRVATDVSPKRGRKRNGDSLVTGSGRGRKKKEM